MIDMTSISNQPSNSPQQLQQIVFIDSQIEDFQYLIEEILSNIEIIILKSDRDGIEQITEVLSQKSYSTVHLVSHGSPGCLYLGNTQLNLANLTAYKSNLKSWFTPYYPPFGVSALPSTYSLILYGCNVAAGDTGAEFTTKLQNITGAAIAASTTPVGNANKGGNWELDFTQNAPTAPLAFTSEAQQNYPGVFTVTTNGTVFIDYNNDGTQQPTNDAEEVGYEGIAVIAYDASDNIVAQTTTDSDGNYSLLTPDGTPLRIEFDGLPEGFVGSSIAGTDSVSNLFFIDGTVGSTNTANFGIHRPHEVTTGDSADIDLITVCYVEGIGNGASAIIIHNYDAAGSDSSDPVAPEYTQLVTYDQIGSVNGLAYHRQSETLFTGSYYKRHSALLGTVDFINNGNANDSSNDENGVAYTSVLYSIDNTGNVSEFARLDDILDPRGAVTDSSQTYWEIDNGADGTKGNEIFDAVGKTGLGDVELSEDGKTLWTVNLNDNKVYRLPVDNPDNPTPPNASEIDSFELVTSILNNGGDLGVNPQENIRPFALSTRDGLVYVGMINSGQYDANGVEGNTSAADMRAYVYTIDPNNPDATPSKVLDIPLNYARDQVERSNSAYLPADWNPWVSTFPDDRQQAFNNEISYPQPMLTDIDFDPDGNMILGFRDRFGDQMGNGVQPPEGGSTLLATAAGDILLAPYDNSTDTWTIESHVTTDGINGANDPDGEFFRNDFLEDNAANDSLQVHAETTQGGLTVVPGFTEVVTTAMDPTDIFQGGLEWFNTDEETGTFAGHFTDEGGLTVSGLEIFDNGDAGTAGKANGLGDLEFIAAPALIDIGNRIWFDTDKDGIQDVGESGVPDGVTLELYNPNGSLFGTTTTANGQYSFSGLSPFTDYEVRLINTDFLAGGSLQGYEPTLAKQGSDDQLDSDASTKGGSGVPIISFTTGAPGENDFSLDIGLTNNPPTYDYGDAPDAASGTGAENYQTTDSDGGARHIIANGLTIGNDVNSDDGTLQNTAADADLEQGVTFNETLQVGDGSFTANVDVNLANNISDNFSSGDYTGGIGWLGDWTESGESNGANNGLARIISNRLELRGDTVEIYREIDMSAATGDATLTFNYSHFSLDTDDEGYEIVVSDGSGNETVVKDIVRTEAGTSPNQTADESDSITIPQSFLTANTRITLRSRGVVSQSSGDYVYLDNVDITAPGVEVPATLVGWIDFNQDGQFTANESVREDVTSSGNVPITWNSFPDIEEGSTYARFRLSTDDALNTIEDADSIGELRDGEVEDYRLGVGRDYGDAPDLTIGETIGDYKTTQADGGASHGIIDGLSIGNNIDPDSGELQNTAADADNTNNEDDEDGVTFATSLSLDDDTYTASVNVINTTGQDALLTGWIDFDQSGTFDPDEQQSIVFSESGTQNLLWDSIPNDLEEGTTYARFRLSNDFSTTTESVTTTIFSENFEGSGTDWTLGTGNGEWEIGDPNAYDSAGIRQLEDANNGTRALITDLQGSSAGDVDGSVIAQSKTFTLNGGTGTHSIDFSYYFAVRTSSPTDEFTVEIVNADNTGDRATIFTSPTLNTNDDPTAVWTDVVNQSINSSFNGKNVYLEFKAQDGGGDDTVEAGVDDIKLTYTADESVPVDLAPDGALETGEVEDYVISVGLDYGDAPDTTSGEGQGDYQTTKDNGGASHVIVNNLIIGSEVDADDTTLQNTEANADDLNNSPDDEDGVSFATNLKVDDTSYNATVQVTNNTGSDAKLVGWIDFNQDGVFDPNESVVANVPTGNTDTDITLTWDNDSNNDAINNLEGNGFFGTTILPGTTYARFRLSTDAAFDGDNPLGTAGDGEVEDYKLIVGLDYGDARDSNPGTGEANYNTLATDDGASHIIDSNLSIGYITDADDGKAQNDNATADDGQGVVGQLSYEYYPITSAVDSVDDIPTAGATAFGTIVPDTGSNLATQITDITQFGVADPDTFGIRFTGSIFIANPGEYTFYTTSDDGSTLSINNTQVVDNDGRHGSREGSGTYTFDSAGYYPIEIEYFENTGGNSLTVEYESTAASVTRQNIPASVLSTNDEEGIKSFSTLRTDNTSYSLDVTVENTTSNAATLIGWIDFDRSGTFDPNEAVSIPVPINTSGNLGETISLNWTNIPDDITAGVTSARFRLSTDPDLDINSPTGLLDDGEVEDYTIEIVGIDYGDAPDTVVGANGEDPGEYKTRLADGGASHQIIDGLKLGATVDADKGTLQNTSATADDLDNKGDDDDEDGITFNTLSTNNANGTYTVNVEYTNDTGSDANIIGWIDFNQNGEFEASEASNVFTASTSVFDSNTTLTWNIPAGIKGGTTFARFRISNDTTNLTTALPTGDLTSGEVEDYQIFVNGGTDFGDAAFADSSDSYAATTTSHSIVRGFSLGNAIDDDPIPTANADANADDNTDTDDEDGVIFNSNLKPTDTEYSVEVDITVITSLTATDDFSTGNLTGGVGWSNNWTDPDSDSGIFNEQLFSIADTGESGISRQFDFSFASGDATLTFDYTQFRLDTGESYTIQVDDGQGGTPVDVLTIDSTTTASFVADNPHSFTIPQSLLTAGTTTISIVPNTVDGDDTEGVLLDNINITAPVPTANLVGWIDFNGDGDFEDTGESTTVSVSESGTQTLTWSDLASVPGGLTTGDTYARFRLSTDSNLTVNTPTGSLNNGEVEDYKITIAELDYGDAPDTGTGTGTDNYQTTDADDGPNHLIVSGLSIGTAPDGDSGDLNNPAADDDDSTDTADEDGVTLPDTLAATSTSYSATVNVNTNPGDNANLVGWIDFDRDGEFEPDEASDIISNINTDGDQTLTWSNLDTLPDGIASGTSYVRLRLTTDTLTTSDSTGAASDGEVQDHQIAIADVDYGDAPDTGADTGTGNYETTDKTGTADDGASHIISTGLTIGTEIDGDSGNLANTAADDDDEDGTTDDEDGVTDFGTLAVNADSYSLEVSVNNPSASEGATLIGWIDFDRDGIFEADEASNVISSINNSNDGTQTLNWSNISALPDGINAGTSYIRLRYTTDALTTADSTGAASDGEVEDYQINIAEADYGDAPDTGIGFGAGNYETTDKTGSADDGASHGIIAGLSLGDDIDGDDGTLQNTAADEDDTDVTENDEDGVTSFNPLDVNDTSYSVSIDVTNTTGIAGGANLVGWIDFNGNGQFETSEASNIITGITSTGSQTLTWDNGANSLPGIEAGSTYVRFRLSTETITNADSIGALVDGEVEDYRITILGGQDFGDATNSNSSPTDSYAATTTSHDIVDGLSIGNAIDNDSTPTANADANADDNTGARDEDGVTFTNNLKVTDEDYSVTVDVINTTGNPAELIGWIDFNGNGTFESGEASNVVSVSASGQATLNWIGITPVAGDTYARFRLNDTPANLNTNTPTGALGGGEIEDYKITVAEVDFGDAPDATTGTGAGNYQTINRTGTADDGASHAIVAGLSIGDEVDGDNGALENIGADADDNNGKLSYEYYNLTSPGTVNDIPATGADLTGAVDLSGNLITQVTNIAQPGIADPDNFGIRYTGSIYIVTPGEYTFYTTSDDGSTLSIDGALIVNNDALQASNEESGTYTFDTAGYYPIEIEYFERTGQNSLTIEYQSVAASVTRQNIPANVLFTDDEDGVTLPDTLAANSTSYSVTVDVTNITGDDANLVGWIDFDGDGEFEADEASDIITGINTDGTQTITWNNLATLPDGIVAGETFARFRLTTDTLTTADSIGEANDGEVEDHSITIQEVDYGDAPDTGLGFGNDNYETTNKTGTANDGPSHVIVSGLSLGDDIDGDDGTQQSPAANTDDSNGDTPDDEDGVLDFDFFPAAANSYSIDVDVINTLGTGANLVGWIDFDRDGIFEPWEASTIISNITDADSTQELTWSNLQSRLGDITSGDTYVRLRLTTDTLTTASSLGAASDGEVEDYTISIQDIDFGDAPDTGAGTGAGNYETTNKNGIGNDGASHVIVSGLSIGTAPDGDSGELQNPAADDDDTTDTADEDGVTIPDTLAANSTSYSINVDVNNTLGTGANLVGWIDFNGDGNFDASEASTPITGINSSGPQTLNWTGLNTLPDGITAGTSYVRLRLTTDTLTTADSTGTANDGEVQDHQITIGAVDYGDAPDTGVGIGAGNYETTNKTGTANDGPSHVIVSGFSLGDDIDGDSGSLQNGAAEADDDDGTPIDEDGVASFGTLNTTSTTYSLTVDVTNTVVGKSGNLIGWIDFDGDGEFEAGEASNIVTGITSTGAQVLTWDNGTDPLPGIKSGTTYARFRLTTDTLTDTSSTGTASDGEVEDYRIAIEGGQDFGDATNSDTTPTDSYLATTTSHDIVSGLSIGDNIDHDDTPTANAAADADDTTNSDDEDGVTFTSILKNTDTTYSINVDATNTTGSAAELIGWIDLNGDGDFDDPNEASSAVSVTSSGEVTLDWTGISPTVGTTYARFRLNDNPGNMDTNTPTGALDGGEVEDYLITIKNDVSGNGSSETLTNATAGIDDIFTGGAGQDTITGNGGDDCFHFNRTSDGIDVITDFNSGDKLDFSDMFATGGELAGVTITDNPFDDGYIATSEIGGGTLVQIDFVLGDGLNNKNVVYLENYTGISANDFIF